MMRKLFWKKTSAAFAYAFLAVLLLGVPGVLERLADAYGDWGYGIAGVALGALVAGFRAAQALFTRWESPPEQ